MDVKLETAAMKGYELPKGLTLAEQGYYLALRTLYAAYQKGVVTKKQAADNFRDNQTLEAADAFYAAVFNLSENWRKEMEEK